MPYTIVTEFKLDCGHRIWNQDIRQARGKEFYAEIPDHAPSKCANIHGHTLMIFIALESDTLDEQGYVIHTGLFKASFKQVLDKIDHAFIIDKHDPLFSDFDALAKKGNLHLFVVDFSPTYENLAKYFYNAMVKIIKKTPFKDEVRVVEVKIASEHMASQAIYRGD